MFFHKVPFWVKFLYPGYVWNGNREEPTIYLTFDDGPVLGVTDYVLEELQKRRMRATFFMVGENILKFPSLAKKVLNQGNKIGNHTQNHLKGTETSLEDYIKNVHLCQQSIKTVLGIDAQIFRPPYGRMNKQQKNNISQTHKIIMWDILSGDYRSDLNPNQCLETIKGLVKNGSILLFHDQEKTADILKQVLPGFLDYVVEKEWNTGLL